MLINDDEGRKAKDNLSTSW